MQHVTDSKPNAGMPQPPPTAADSYQQGCIKMTLENADLWKTFHRIGTEMIITKHGRRMFPHCNVSLSGLQPYANYVIMVDMVPVDSLKYKWNKEQWEAGGKAEPQPPCRTYLHPDSPAMGNHWMKRSLSFLKMKLTNNTLDQHGHIILHSMHRYCPRFHVIQADSPYTVRWGPFQTFSFPETSFTSVTAYQNPKITKLKIDHNPFAKGFREGGTHSHSKRCRSSGSPSSAAKKATLDGRALCKNPAGLQRTPSASLSVEVRKCQASAEETLKEGHFSPWAVEQDPPESLHAEPLELQDYSCEEQMVPASLTYQPYRSAECGTLPSPSNRMEDCDGRRSHDSHVSDVATVPRHDQANRFELAGDAGRHQHLRTVIQNEAATPCQEYRHPAVNMPKANPGALGSSLHGPGYQPEQSAGQWGEVRALTHPTAHPLAKAEHATQPHGYHHHGNTAEWSQYPLFSYSCW